jgi:hypothetical protein
MPRYFLHIKEGPDVVIDPEGQNFADLPAAQVEAVEVARDLMAERLRAGRPMDLNSEVIVSDEHGDTLARVEFQAALRSDDPS